MNERAMAMRRELESHEDLVARAIDDVRAKQSTSGACGAAMIANLVAWRLNERDGRARWGLLGKRGGNRAVWRDGHCVDAPDANELGVAVDYLIDSDTYYGTDILGDAGGGNSPRWGEPETTEVPRNRDNFVSPIDPSAYLGATPDQPDQPTDPGTTDPARPSRIEAQLDTLLTTVAAMAVEQAKQTTAIIEMRQGVEKAALSLLLVLKPRKRAPKTANASRAKRTTKRR